jgi:hypothetical protein
MNKPRVVEAIAAQALFAELYRHYMGDWDPMGNILVWHSPRICLVPAQRAWYEMAFAAWLASLAFDKFRGFATVIEGLEREVENVVKEPKFRRALFQNWFQQNVTSLDEVAYNSEAILTVPEALLALRLLLPRLKEDDYEAVVQEMEWTIWGFLAVQAGASWISPTKANIAEIKRALVNVIVGTLQGLADSDGNIEPFSLLETLIGKEKRDDLLTKARRFGLEGLAWFHEYLKQAEPGLLEIDLTERIEGSDYDFTSRQWITLLLNGIGLAYSARYVSELPRNFVWATQRRLIAWFRGMKVDALDSWLNS